MIIAIVRDKNSKGQSTQAKAYHMDTDNEFPVLLGTDKNRDALMREMVRRFPAAKSITKMSMGRVRKMKGIR